MTFVTDIAVADLPDLSSGMVAELTAKGLDRTVRAAVQRVVPRVTGSADTAAPGFLRLVLVPVNATEVRDLVPGLRFTGKVDTRTGPAGPKLVA
ncbi:hypothetical protein [Paractinoplanes durhamensis]|uniref:hypothetical protein n=1 Tax=Paractinoplanes durhamensis TaxID=113563 RepID=UPI001EF302EE|nr:hypothetical protein [Actinoplanes durhamensis]